MYSLSYPISEHCDPRCGNMPDRREDIYLPRHARLSRRESGACLPRKEGEGTTSCVWWQRLLPFRNGGDKSGSLLRTRRVDRRHVETEQEGRKRLQASRFAASFHRRSGDGLLEGSDRENAGPSGHHRGLICLEVPTIMIDIFLISGVVFLYQRLSRLCDGGALQRGIR